MAQSQEFAPVGVSHADTVAQHIHALALLAHDQGVERSRAEAVVSRLGVTHPQARDAKVAEHSAELDSRQVQLARRWLPKITSGITAWRAAPSRESTARLSTHVCDYVTEANFACGAPEPLTLSVAFAESMIAQLPSSIVIWSNPAAWRDYGGTHGQTNIGTLGNKAFAALANPLAVAEATRALEALEAQFVTVASTAAAWGADLVAAQADWEVFQSGKSFAAIVELLNAPTRRKQQIAAAAAETEARRQLIIKARGGDAQARYLLGKEWLSVQGLNPELYGELVP